MSQLIRAKEKFHQLAITDNLTGLLNRRGFNDFAEKQLKIINRGDKYSFLVFIDLDDFKLINDSFGHDVGDSALVETANILRNTFRQSDIIGRLGGDEFTILSTQENNLEDQFIIRQRLDKNLKLWNMEKRKLFKISFSVGMAVYSPKNPCSYDELLTNADALMYEIKKRRKINNDITASDS